jgi:thiamine kinase-like enzyme
MNRQQSNSFFESLPPPSLPVATSKYHIPSCGVKSNSNLFEQWRETQYKKLIKANRIRAKEIKICDTSCDDVLDLRVLWSNPPALKQKLLEIATKLVPKWNQKDCKMERLTAAMTNAIFKLTNTDGKSLLVRVYGSGSHKLFERQRELLILQVLSSCAQGPTLLGMFKNGRFEKYFENSETLTRFEVRDDKISKLIGAGLFEVHSLVGVIPPPGSPAPDEHSIGAFYQSELWHRLFDWYHKALGSLDILRNTGKASMRSTLDALDITSLIEGINKYKNLIESKKDEYPVVFAHNDSQYGNILRVPSKSDKSGYKICIIDYEYACYNYRGFDFANHFCEWAADYHSEQPHVLDFSKLPSREQMANFFEGYLDGRDKFTKTFFDRPARGSSSSMGTLSPDMTPEFMTKKTLTKSPFFSPSMSPSLSPMLTPHMVSTFRRKEVEAMIKETEFFIPLSHLHWALWGIIQAAEECHNDVMGFDYLSYAKQRLDQYRIVTSEL